MKTFHRVFVVCAMVSLTGCATAKMGSVRTTTTPSVRAEVTVPNRTKKEVTDALVGEVVSRGFTVVTVSDYNIVFSKPISTVATSTKRGARSNGTAEQRLSFTIAETSAGVRIVLANQIATNPGSAYEKVSDTGGGPAGEGWRQFLTTFPNIFKGRVGISLDNYNIVTNVLQGSPAMDAGIQKGDKIIRVDGAPYTRTDQLTGEPDTKVIVVVLRQGQEMPFILYRKMLK
ncbi:MAG: PDZ domain-containing protein [Candidatus Edwardsbacteria bacterium]|nr:PDZ domain-containing protein [Candidatus Edwardsbacteria bacterium]